jgi:hypothetical protein
MIRRWRCKRICDGVGTDRHQGSKSVRSAYFGVILALVLAPLASPLVAGEFDVIATSGDSSPDGNGQLVTFTPPALNDAGQVAFLSQLSGTANPPDDSSALFRASTGGLTVVAHQGVTMFGAELITDFINNSPSINSSGTVSHSGEPAGAPGKWVALLGSGGPLETFLEVGSASPSGDNTLVSHSIPVINDAGVAAYRASYSGLNSETGIYSRATGGATTLRLLEGDDAPGGGSILSIAASLPTLNGSSQIALTASVDDDIFTRKAALRLDGTTIVELARDGDLATDGVTTIGNILSNTVPLNDAGQLAFEATFTQPSVSLRQGVFRAEGGGVSLLASGILPGAATVATDVRVTGINNAGEVGFMTDFLGGGDDPASGVYLADDMGPTLIAFEDAATPEGGKFFLRFLTESIALNEDGQLAFLAELSDTANGGFAGRGLFLYDPASGLEQIARTGQMFEGSTIASLNFVGDFYSASQIPNDMNSPDPNFSGLNNTGQVAFVFSLANGESGIAVWSPDIVPTPGDFNGDGRVDAGDYVRWRNNLGDADETDLNNNGDGGGVTLSDYTWWKQHYGDPPGSGSLASPSQAAVPEPAGVVLFLTMAATGLIYHRHR